MEKRIDRLHRLAATQPAVIGLGGGLPADRLFPRVALARAFVRAMREPAASALQYAWPEGREGLREWIAARLRDRGLDVRSEEVLVTSGAQQSLAIATQLTLARGDEVAVGSETYPAALDLLRARGALPRAQSANARVAYAMPAIGNPHGRPLSADVCRDLLARMEHVIEDDAYAELRFDGRMPVPLAAHARDRVWHVGTFSKTLCPGLRVGWLIPPPAWRDRAVELKHATDLQSSSLGQTVLELFLAEDDFDRRLARARRFYERQAARLLRAVQRHLPTWSCRAAEGGFALFVESDEPGDDLALLETATECGVSFDPGCMFRPQQDDSRLAVRLCFSFVGGEQLAEGVRRLARAWDRHRKERARGHIAQPAPELQP